MIYEIYKRDNHYTGYIGTDKTNGAVFNIIDDAFSFNFVGYDSMVHRLLKSCYELLMFKPYDDDDLAKKLLNEFVKSKLKKIN